MNLLATLLVITFILAVAMSTIAWLAQSQSRNSAKAYLEAIASSEALSKAKDALIDALKEAVEKQRQRIEAQKTALARQQECIDAQIRVIEAQKERIVILGGTE